MLQFKMILLSRFTKERLKTIPSLTGSWFRKFAKIFFDIVWQGIFILALIVAAMWYPVHWLTKPIPTQIQIDLITDHLSFRVTEAIALNEPIKFHEATLRYFDTLSLSFNPAEISYYPASRIHVIFPGYTFPDPFKKEEKTEQTPPLKKEVLSESPPYPFKKGEKTEQTSPSPLGKEEFSNSVISMQLKAKSDKRFFPKIVLKTTTREPKNFGVLKQLNIATNTKMVLSTPIHQELNIAIENTQPQASPPFAILQHSSPFKVTTRYCELEGIPLPLGFEENENSNFEINQLSRRNPMLTVTGQPEQLKLTLSVLNDQVYDMVPMGISITDLDFSWQDMVDGERVINYANIKSGTIRYPAYSTIAPVNFDSSNMLALGKTDTFKVEQMTLIPNEQGIKLRLSGLASEPVKTFLKVSSEISIDRRLTYSEVLPETSKFYKVMFDVILWFIPIIIGIIGIVAINIVKILPSQQQQQQSQ